MKNKTNYYPKFIPWENTPYKPNMKNKTKEVKADWEKEFDNKFLPSLLDFSLEDNLWLDNYANIKKYIKKNFVAKGEVRDEIKRWLEHDYYSEGEAWVRAKLVERLLKSLE